MKKRSAANSTTKLRNPAVFFLDACLGKHRIAEELRKAGETVIVHDEHFPQGTPDEVWLTDVGNQGWVILTKDDNIRYRKTEHEAVISAEAAVFVLPRGNLKAPVMADILVKALPRIKIFLQNHRPPFIARIAPGGTVSLLK